MKTKHFSAILGSLLIGSITAQNNPINKPNLSERGISADFNKVKGNLNTMFN